MHDEHLRLFLSSLPTDKIRYLCSSHISGIYRQAGQLFDLSIAGVSVDDYHVSYAVALIPKSTTIFISRYLTDLSELHPHIHEPERCALIRVKTSNSFNPKQLTLHDLRRFTVPINHRNNLRTTIDDVTVDGCVLLDYLSLEETPYLTVERIRSAM